MNNTAKKIMLVAGEASGDQRGAEVAIVLLTKDPTLTLFGIGGEHMRKAGVKTVADVKQLSVMGFFEPLKHLPRLFKIFSCMKKHLKKEKPNLLLLIDNPGFNLRLARFAKKQNIPVLFYISPQVWAWRQHRVKKIAQVVDHLAVIFPFEKKYYLDENIKVTFVGHPLTKKITQAPTTETAKTTLALTTGNPIITLLPGSRSNEVKRLLPVMLDAMVELYKAKQNLTIVLAHAKTIRVRQIKHILQHYNIPIKITNDAYTAIQAADLVLTASGTATLETALLNKPMIVLYKVNALTALLIKRMLKIPYISLCNIVAGKKIVNELLQQDANVNNLVKESLSILDNIDYQQKIRNNLQTVKQIMGNIDAAENVANIALQMLQQ